MMAGLAFINKLFNIIISSILIITLALTSPTFLTSFAQTSANSKATPEKPVAKKKRISSTENQTANKSVTSPNRVKVNKKRAISSRTKKGKVRGQREIEPSRIVEIQNALVVAGYYKNQPSGKWDAATTQAMSAYQGANGFKVTGKPDALSLKNLGL